MHVVQIPRPVVACLLLTALAVAGSSVRAQTLATQFRIAGTNLLPLRYASIDVMDFNEDDTLDVVLTGMLGSVPFTRVYVSGLKYRTVVLSAEGDTLYGVSYNMMEGRQVTQIGQGVGRGADYDGDGDGDLLLVGLTNPADPGSRVAQMYRNDERILYRDEGVVLPPLSYPAAAWGDYDGDGDPDLVLAGDDGTGPVTRLFRNDPAPGGGRSFTDVGAALVGVARGAVAWGDYDADGDPDLVLSGLGDPHYGLVTRLYRNDRGPGGSTFVEAQALTGVLGGSLSWGDYDGDGDLDLLVAGAVLDPGLLRGATSVYRNDAGRFVEVDLGLPDVIGSAQWGDYDDDGDLDVLVAGERDLMRPSLLYVFLNRDGVFQMREQHQAFNLSFSTWFDATDNGRLDIVTTGQQEVNGPASLMLLVNVTLPFPIDPDP